MCPVAEWPLLPCASPAEDALLAVPSCRSAEPWPCAAGKEAPAEAWVSILAPPAAVSSRPLSCSPRSRACRSASARAMSARMPAAIASSASAEEAISVALPWLRVRGVVVLGVMVVVGVMVVCWCSGRDGFWSTSFCIAR